MLYLNICSYWSLYSTKLPCKLKKELSPTSHQLQHPLHRDFPPPHDRQIACQPGLGTNYRCNRAGQLDWLRRTKARRLWYIYACNFSPCAPFFRVGYTKPYTPRCARDEKSMPESSLEQVPGKRGRERIRSTPVWLAGLAREYYNGEQWLKEGAVVEVMLRLLVQSFDDLHSFFLKFSRRSKPLYSASLSRHISRSFIFTSRTGFLSTKLHYISTIRRSLDFKDFSKVMPELLKTNVAIFLRSRFHPLYI